MDAPSAASVQLAGLDAAGALLRASQRTVALTGAGISTESGIPDFRGTSGPSGYDAADFAFQRFVSSIDSRRRYWRWARSFYPRLRDAEPNGAHRALAEMESAGRLRCVITQNIDDLHRRAGSRDVIELHGNAFRVGCLGCGKEWSRDEIHARLESGDDDPSCDACDGILKPKTISFGQPMPEPETARAFSEATAANVIVVIGSALGVFPAAGLVPAARRAGARVVVVNLESTPFDGLADVVLTGRAGVLLPELALRLRMGSPGAPAQSA